MPRYDSFLSLQSTPWFQAQFDLTLAALGKKRKKAARGVRFKSGLLRGIHLGQTLIFSYSPVPVHWVVWRQPPWLWAASAPARLLLHITEGETRSHDALWLVVLSLEIEIRGNPNVGVYKATRRLAPCTTHWILRSQVSGRHGNHTESRDFFYDVTETWTRHNVVRLATVIATSSIFRHGAVTKCSSGFVGRERPKPLPTYILILQCRCDGLSLPPCWECPPRHCARALLNYLHSKYFHFIA